MPRQVLRGDMETPSTPARFPAPSTTVRRIKPTKVESWPSNYYGPVGFTNPPIALNIKPRKEAKETITTMDFIDNASDLECDCRCNLKTIFQKKKVPDTPQSPDQPDGTDLLNPATPTEEAMEEGDRDPPQPSNMGDPALNDSVDPDLGYHSAMDEDLEADSAEKNLQPINVSPIPKM